MWLPFSCTFQSIIFFFPFKSYIQGKLTYFLEKFIIIYKFLGIPSQHSCWNNYDNIYSCCFLCCEISLEKNWFECFPMFPKFETTFFSWDAADIGEICIPHALGHGSFDIVPVSLVKTPKHHVLPSILCFISIKLITYKKKFFVYSVRPWPTSKSNGIKTWHMM